MFLKTSDQSDIYIDQIDRGRRQLDVSATQRFFGEAFQPLEYLEQPGSATEFEYLDQFAPFSFEDLQSIERAAEKRKREDEIAFQAEFYPLHRPSVDKMATASDVDMKTNLAGEPSSKRACVEEEASVDVAEAAKRKAILESVGDAGLKGFMSWMFENTDKSGEKHTALGKSVEVLGKSVEVLDKKVSSTEARLTALEQRDAASVHSASSTMTPGGGKAGFCATYLECHGWVVDWSTPLTRSQTMIGDDDASELLKNVMRILESDDLVHACIDQEGSNRLVQTKPMHASIRVKFKSGTDKDTLYTAQTILTKLNNDLTLRMGLFENLTAPLLRIRFRVEAPPWKKPHSQAVGRFHGEWAKLHATVAIKGTVGAGKTASTMWTDAVDGKRLQFAEFRAAEFEGSGQWVVYPDVWAVFSRRHSFREDVKTIEAAVATRSH